MSKLPNYFHKCVIAIASAKGGVGKSTHTYNMASYYHVVLEKNVLVLDVEKKPAISEIAYQGKRVEGKKLDIKHYFSPTDLIEDIEMFKTRYDIILIDTAGADVDINSGVDVLAQEAMNESALAAADFVLVPVKPSALDARKTLKFASSLTKWMLARRGGLKALCFLNEARINENLTNEVHNQMKNGLPIEYRTEAIAYSPYVGESILYGLAMHEYKPSHKVTFQMNSLADDVMELTQAHLEALNG